MHKKWIEHGKDIEQSFDDNDDDTEFIEASAPTIPTSADSVSRLDYIVRTSTAVQSILSKEYG